jgi:hypothetical protein
MGDWRHSLARWTQRWTHLSGGLQPLWLRSVAVGSDSWGTYEFFEGPAPRGHFGASCHGSSCTVQRDVGQRSRAQAKKSEPSGSSIVRCWVDTTIQGHSESCSVRVKRYSHTNTRSHACQVWGACSERNGFAFDLLAGVIAGVLQSGRGHDVHGALQQILQIALQRGLLEQARPVAHLNEYVQISA